MSISEAASIIVAEFSEIIGQIAIDFVPAENVAFDSNLLAQCILATEYGASSASADASLSTDSFLFLDVDSRTVARPGVTPLYPTHAVAALFVALPDTTARGLTRSVCLIVVSDDRTTMIGSLDTVSTMLSDAAKQLRNGAIATFGSDMQRLMGPLLLTIALVHDICTIIGPVELDKPVDLEALQAAIRQSVLGCDMSERWNQDAISALEQLLVAESQPHGTLHALRKALEMLMGVSHGANFPWMTQFNDAIQAALSGGRPKLSKQTTQTGSCVLENGQFARVDVVGVQTPSFLLSLPLPAVPGRLRPGQGASLRSIRRLAELGYTTAMETLRSLHAYLARPAYLVNYDQVAACDSIMTIISPQVVDNKQTPSTQVEDGGWFAAVGSCLAATHRYASVPIVSQDYHSTPMSSESRVPLVQAATVAPPTQSASLYVTRLTACSSSTLHSVLYNRTAYAKFSEGITADVDSPSRLPMGADQLPEQDLSHITENATTHFSSGAAQSTVLAHPSSVRLAIQPAQIEILARLSATSLWPLIILSLFSTSVTIIVGRDERGITELCNALQLLCYHSSVLTGLSPRQVQHQLPAAPTPLAGGPILLGVTPDPADDPSCGFQPIPVREVPNPTPSLSTPRSLRRIPSHMSVATTSQTQPDCEEMRLLYGPYGIPVQLPHSHANVFDMTQNRAFIFSPLRPGPLLAPLCRPATEFPSSIAWFSVIQSSLSDIALTGRLYAELLAEGARAPNAALTLGISEATGLFRRSLKLTSDWLAVCCFASIFFSGAERPPFCFTTEASSVSFDAPIEYS